MKLLESIPGEKIKFYISILFNRAKIYKKYSDNKKVPQLVVETVQVENILTDNLMEF